MTAQVDPATLAAHLEDLAKSAQILAADLRNGLAYLRGPEPHADVEARPVAADPDALLDIAALSRLLLVDSRTLRRWRQSPDFPKALKLGGPLRWRRSDIEAWMVRRPR